MKMLKEMKWISLLFLLISSPFLNAKTNTRETSLEEIQWRGDRLDYFSSPRLIFRPVEEGRDLEAYQDLFKNPTAMRYYLNGQPRDITSRFRIWEKRWERHNFSALAVYLKADPTDPEAALETFVGHVILGHGDYQGDPTYGFSEAALIIHPYFWNANYVSADKDIGTANQVGIGTEVIRAIRDYGQELFENGYLVPVDVTAEQQEEVQHLIQGGIIPDYIANEKGEIEAVLIPFGEMRATCLRENVASWHIFNKIFVEENGGTLISPTPTDPTRDLFISPLH